MGGLDGQSSFYALKVANRNARRKDGPPILRKIDMAYESRVFIM